MKKTRLVIDFEYDFELIGISSSIKFYKLAWALNQQLNWNLVKGEDHRLENFMGQELFFDLYEEQNSEGAVQVFANRSVDNRGALLTPEFPHFDYWVKIYTGLQSFAVKEVVKELKEVQWIEYIAAIELETIKSKDNFLD